MKWLRLYHDALHDPKVQRLDGETFKCWVNLLMVASTQDERDGVLPPLEDLAFIMRITPGEMAGFVDTLHTGRLLDRDPANPDVYEIHNWKQRQPLSDDSYARVRKYRAITREMADTPTETPHETLHGRDSNDDETVSRRDSNSLDKIQIQIQREKEIQKETQIQNTPAPAGLGGARTKRLTVLTRAQLAEFDRWWPVYPKHAARKQAEEQWGKVNSDGTLTDEIIAGTEVQKRGSKFKRGYIPEPHRFLRDLRWRDEAEPLPDGGGSGPKSAGGREALQRLRQQRGHSEDRVIEAAFTFGSGHDD